MRRALLRLPRLLISAVLAGAFTGVAGSASAQQTAALAVTVTVVRSCTVTDGTPDCGTTAGASPQAGASTTQPAPRTTTTSPSQVAPDGTSGRSAAAAPVQAGHTVATVQF